MATAHTKERKIVVSGSQTQATFTYGEYSVPYTIVSRNTAKDKAANKIKIHVLPSGVVQVEAPANSTTENIKSAVQKRASWIVNHLNAIKDRNAFVLPREYISGETHFYLGRRYLLKLVEQLPDSSKPGAKLERGKLTVFANQPKPEQTKRLLNDWYRNRAREVFARRLTVLCDKLSWVKQMPDWQLLAMTKQWGSCSPSGKLSLNPQLVKAPTECVDYVLLHELCHLQEHNHSARFYELLERAMPNWHAVKGKLDAMAELILNE